LIIIDTDVLIEISDKRSKKGDQIYQRIISSGDNVAITSITMYEALYSLMKYTKPFHHLFSFHVYVFSNEDAQQAARLEISLEKKGKKIKRTDIMIASTVMNKGATLCTFDNDFQALEDYGLKIIRWV
jgi:predicted nucleic acid-binding protein